MTPRFALWCLVAGTAGFVVGAVDLMQDDFLPGSLWLIGGIILTLMATIWWRKNRGAPGETAAAALNDQPAPFEVIRERQTQGVKPSSRSKLWLAVGCGFAVVFVAVGVFLIISGIRDGRWMGVALGSLGIVFFGAVPLVQAATYGRRRGW